MAQLDAVSNFAKADLTAGIASGVTTFSVGAGDGALFPDPSVIQYNITIYDSTNFINPADDPNHEIMRVTARAGDNFTVVRAQEGTADVNHNTAATTYTVILAITKKMIDDIRAALQISAGAGGNKLLVQTTPQTLSGASSNVPVTLMSVTIPANYLGTNNGVRFEAILDQLVIEGGDDLDILLKYGGNTIATLSITGNAGSSMATIAAKITGLLLANNANNAQKGSISFFAGLPEVVEPAYSSNALGAGEAIGTGAVDSTQDQTFEIVAVFSNNSADNLMHFDQGVIDGIKSTGFGIGAAEQNIGGFPPDVASFSSDSEVSLINIGSSADGLVMYKIMRMSSGAFGDAGALVRYEKDEVTGAYYQTHSTSIGLTSWGSRSSAGVVEIGNYVYVISKNPSNARFDGKRYDKADLGNEATLVFSGNPTTSASAVSAFSDGTDLFATLTATSFRQFSISGLTLSLVGDIAGSMSNPRGTFMEGGNVYMVAISTVQVFTISGGNFVAGAQISIPVYNLGKYENDSTDIENEVRGIVFLASNAFYYGYFVSVWGDSDGDQRGSVILKAFRRPS